MRNISCRKRGHLLLETVRNGTSLSLIIAYKHLCQCLQPLMELPPKASSSSPTQDSVNTTTTLWKRWSEWFNVKQDQVELAKSLQSLPDNETGWERIQNSWQSYLDGEDCFEFNIISNAIFFGGLLGITFGGFANSKDTLQQLIRQHNTNVYDGKYRANRHLADSMYLTFFRQSTRTALKYALFSGLFVGPLTLSITYRNDVLWADSAACAALSGAIWRFHLGPRAMLVNAVVGSLFGLTFASIIKLYLKANNTSIREIRYYHTPIVEND